MFHCNEFSKQYIMVKMKQLYKSLIVHLQILKDETISFWREILEVNFCLYMETR